MDWIEGYYNRRRIHSSTGYRTPVQAEERLGAAWNAVPETEAGSQILRAQKRSIPGPLQLSGDQPILLVGGIVLLLGSLHGKAGRLQGPRYSLAIMDV